MYSFTLSHFMISPIDIASSTCKSNFWHFESMKFFILPSIITFTFEQLKKLKVYPCCTSSPENFIVLSTKFEISHVLNLNTFTGYFTEGAGFFTTSSFLTSSFFGSSFGGSTFKLKGEDEF